ncbi:MULTISPECIES: F-box protein [unclassified Legionella]|uniref:F-box protein n=1 Tax=unclassified Legionella TaxID=2622702 RepID=UPI001E43CE34|nr:F-box protein [Legionella sp. 31fI33]MCC5015099.1 F-box protein [Legionella sp. 31fI33]
MNYDRLQAKINHYLDIFGYGYISEQKLKHIAAKLPSLKSAYLDLKRGAELTVALHSGNVEAIARLTDLIKLGGQITKLEQLASNASRGLIQFQSYRPVTKNPLPLGAPLQKANSEPSPLMQLPNELLMRIFQNLSFYEKQSNRLLSKRIHNVIESCYIEENVLVFPIKDKKIVFFLDPININGSLTVNDYFKYINNGCVPNNGVIVFERYLQGLVNKDVEKRMMYPYSLASAFSFIASMINSLVHYQNSNVLKSFFNQNNLTILLIFVVILLALNFRTNQLKQQAPLKYGSFFNPSPQSMRGFKELMPSVGLTTAEERELAQDFGQPNVRPQELVVSSP